MPAPQILPPKLQQCLAVAVAQGASDLHLAAGYQPAIRLHGDLVELAGPPLAEAELQGMFSQLCPGELFAKLLAQKNLDWAFDAELDGQLCRFRANLFHAGGCLAACLRIVPPKIPSFEWAGFPRPLAEKLAFLRDGLVIFTGATGSGKTTSLAMIVNLLNQAGGYRIITVEEPLEYQFPHAPHSLVTQREVGPDVLSFADGLKYGLRQDPDVILVGEVRDRETAQMALSAAETGHLVFTTLHTRDAKGAISRYADLFPQDVQSDVRYQLASSLRAVVAQRLLPALERGAKRHLALEVLWNITPIVAGIRQGKLESIDNYLLTSKGEGLISFDESVRQLFRAGLITRQIAEQNVRDLGYLNR
ncbi:MAG TPA: PilT/PilU family type 4a pilus ATPase [Pirellulaceae bacterium]|nr:PilT/PilU family type 4a pilus ATPase [Pirellulaceae bacterium]